jgi:hypothetical protein
VQAAGRKVGTSHEPEPVGFGVVSSTALLIVDIETGVEDVKRELLVVSSFVCWCHKSRVRIS